MLNLEELDAKLDAALAAETAESLTRWLFNKRASNLSFLGSGKVLSYRTLVTTFKPACSGRIEFKNVENHIPLGDDNVFYCRPMDISEQIKIVFHGVNFVNINFSANKPYDNSRPVDLSIEPKVFYPQDQPQDFQIVFKVEVKADNFFILSVQAIGEFSIEQEVDNQIKENFLNANAPAIVFPYIRSFIATLTSNLGSVTGTVVLPPQFFKGPLEEIIINSQAEEV